MKSGTTWIILGAAMLVIVLRLAVALPVGQSPLIVHPVLEDQAYQARALEVAHGTLWPATLPRGSVLYPLLAGCLPGMDAGSPRPLAIFQSILEGLTALLLMLWVRRRWGGPAAIAAGLLYAFDPLGGIFAARFTPVVPATLLFLAALWLWDREREPGEKAGLGRVAILALCLTLGFLLSPLLFLCLALVRLVERLRASRPFAHRATPAAILIAALPLALILAAATGLVWRHASLPGGAPVLGWGGGPVAWQAFHPGTLGTPRFIEPPAWRTETDLKEESHRLGGGREVSALSRTLTREALRQAFGRPLPTIGVLLAKAGATVAAFPVPDALSPTFLASRHARIFSYLAWSFALLLALAAGGFRRLRGDPTRFTIALGLLAVGAACLAGTTSAAARQPGLPLLAALGGAWLASLAGRSRPVTAGTSRHAGIVAGAVFALSVLAALILPTRALRNPSEDLRLVALTFSQTLNWRQAVPLLEEAVKVDPTNLEARIALADGYRADALPAAAAQQLDAAWDIDSTHAGTVFTRARQRLEENEIQEAKRLMERLVAAHPKRAVYLRELGALNAKLGDYALAEAQLSRAVRLDPDDRVTSNALQQLVSTRMQMENALFPEEIRFDQDEAFSTALPRVVDAMEQARWSEADSLLRWMESARPELATTHWMRAGYLARRGDKSGSIAALERCQRIAPGRPAVLTQLTRLYLETGRQERIEPLFRTSLAAVAADSLVAQQVRLMMGQLGLKP